ncbi:hypothetical protein POTOM_000062 [Populus tomentosa]|uniref:15-cis-phytoene synthase n=1 Tax=Populus tomentosa TaxID=118781 RepID=A0A8X8AUB8_POPTO|nr:hypothetical protein POTOM_000062 [Populus tomentosa]
MMVIVSRCRNSADDRGATESHMGNLCSEDRRSNSVDPHIWCRRTDELVDGPNAVPMSTDVLDRWEERLQDIFDGRPYDMLDAALTDTISKFPLDIKPFRGMIEGMRMDTTRFRYDNFQELYLYCYYVAGTVGLMSVPVMGIAAESEASAQSIIMRHCAWVLEISLQTFLEMWERSKFFFPALRGRVYLPQDELAQFGLCVLSL